MAQNSKADSGGHDHERADPGARMRELDLSLAGQNYRAGPGGMCVGQLAPMA